MWMTKMRIVTAVVLAVGIVTGTLGVVQQSRLTAEPAQAAVLEAAPLSNEAADPAENAQKQEKGEAVSVRTMPPVVVQTVPQAGETQINAAATTQIRVTFSKNMEDNSWSWSMISNETFPQLAGKPHYEKDQRTCVLPVKLEPGRTYVIWLNSEKFKNFRDTEGNPAVPYLLVFETKR